MIANLGKSQSYGVGIRGLGYYVPEKIVTNHDLAKRIDTSDEWIRTKIGVRERRWAAEHQALSDLAVEAGRRALENAGLEPGDIDLIVLARVDPDHIDPSTAFLVQHKLGMKHAGAFDAVIGGCPGSVYGIAIGANFVASGSCKNVLVIAGDILSRNILNWDDRNTCCFFGDGAGAMVLGRVEKGKGIQTYLLDVDGSRYDACIIPAGGTRMPITRENVDDAKVRYLRMDNGAVWNFATTVFPQSIQQVAAAAGIDVQNIDFVIPHQANINIIKLSMEKLGLGMEKTHTTIEKYGNTGGASPFITLTEAVELGKVKAGDKVALVSFGAGLAWAAMLVEWNEKHDFIE
ncbi:3-oxoacyl-ACP synthase III family protein [Thermotalea metallivorans]|uniref:3-oxoacyl-[acyl-carrier-protein] synthase 3 protein 1 n=1 Tax=Thermotalea metallivorans TaxID=520762 RepID=A0A140L797_9FIRM|nr:beta-ketoacyl-ACP synthase III [Thermotalea metallivorans]KXG76422.1 3-oxoacyl-[acyl-carrier-protein] synthase 3 protein 1 [Thermotalea metallivorans]